MKIKEYKLELSEQLARDIERAAICSGNTLSEVIRKALSLFLVAHQANAQGLGIGLYDRETGVVHDDIVGINSSTPKRGSSREVD